MDRMQNGHEKIGTTSLDYLFEVNVVFTKYTL